MESSSNKRLLYETINNPAYNREQRKKLAMYIHMVLLKGIFGGQSDSVLMKMRKIIRRI